MGHTNLIRDFLANELCDSTSAAEVLPMVPRLWTVVMFHLDVNHVISVVLPIYSILREIMWVFAQRYKDPNSYSL